VNKNTNPQSHKTVNIYWHAETSPSSQSTWVVHWISIIAAQVIFQL